MRPFANALEHLHTAITTATTTTDWVRPHPRLSPAAQIAIYQEAYHLRLRAAVITDYPALRCFLGDVAFNQQAADYVHATPPRSYNLDFYSIGFADYISAQGNNPPAAALAALESALTASFLGQDAPPLTIAEVAALSPEQLGASHFQFQQSMRLLSCAYDAESYFSGCKQGTPPEAIAATPLQLLLYRQEHEVRRVRLSAADYALLSALQDGADFNTALAQAQAQTGISQGELAAQIGAWLSGWLQRGLITAVSPQSY